MANKELAKDIESRFEDESNKIVEREKNEDKSGRVVTVVLSVFMTAVVLGSLLYSLFGYLSN